MKVRDMTAGKPAKLILAVALPLMLGNVFQQLYTVVDTMVVGNVLGPSALAALGAAEWFNWLFLGVVQGFTQGFTIPMAQAFGAKDYPQLKKTIGNATLWSAILAVLFTGVALLTIRPVLNLLHTPAEIQPISTRYLWVMFSGLPIVMAYNLLSGILRALGNSKTPLTAMLFAAAINIALDLLFVIVFHWGVTGAAVATLIAQAFSCVYCLVVLRKVSFAHIGREDLKPDREMSARLIKLGMPISFQNAIIAVGGMIVQLIVNDFGVLFIAGYTATNKLYGVLEIAAISYGYAISTYTGQNYGAKKATRIRDGVRAAAITGVITAGLISVAMFAFGHFLVSMFISGDPKEVAKSVAIAWEFLQIMAAYLPILYVLHIYRSALQGLGDTMMPMLSGIIEFLMRTGAALYLPMRIGYQGVFYAEVLAWAGAAVLLVWSYVIRYRSVCVQLAD